MNRLIQCLILSMVALSTTATAQRCGATCANTESLLGYSEQTLVASMPELKRLSKPVQGPRNSRGKWVFSSFIFATQRYVATYYIGMGQVVRIELLNTASGLQCTQRIPFELALHELVNGYGESQVFGSFEIGGKVMQSVAFNSEAADISLHFSMSPDTCTTRVIYKTREVKDASKL